MRAYEEAGLSGLCEEGRWEAAIGAMKEFEVGKAVDANARRRLGITAERADTMAFGRPFMCK